MKIKEKRSNVFYIDHTFVIFHCYMTVSISFLKLYIAETFYYKNESMPMVQLVLNSYLA